MRDLIEDRSQLFQRQNSERVGRDGDDAFGTLLGGEAGSVFQRLVRQRREMESILIRVREPGSAGHGQNGIVALHPNAEKLDRFGTQVSSASVG